MSSAPLLSIIVPTLNETSRITGTLDALQPMRARGVEVIVSDGGSIDDTVARATPLTDRIVHAPRGRAHQMNAGAAVARGDALLFLHADCVLPPAADMLISAGLSGQRKHWGHFDVNLDGRHPLLPLIAIMMNLRSRMTGIATGDQGIFVTRECFVAVGGYAAIPLMEDIELSRRLTPRGAPLCLRARLTASARRWEQYGVFRTILLMWGLRLAFFLGADPMKLAQRYGDSREDSACIAVFAKAPQPGLAKTRLIPLLGATGAATLQDLLIARALATANSAGVGPVTLWCTPSVDYPLLEQAAATAGATRAVQCEGDLGRRMHAAAQTTLAEFSRVIIIGTDCPALTPAALREAATALTDHDAVVIPAEDGGYVLIGLRQCNARLFENVAWGSNTVMAATRRNLDALGWRWREMPASWDVDRAEDFARLAASGLMPEIDALARHMPH